MIDGSDEGGFSSVRVEEGGEDGLVDGDFAFEQHGVAVKCVKGDTISTSTSTLGWSMYLEVFEIRSQWVYSSLS